ncbi:MAG: histidine phosphatase family protein [Rhodospirillaceae bacterium]
MIEVALIRHGPTGWNEEKRLQGRADRPLSETGRAKVSGWRLPAEFRDHVWHVSPLVRAAETARLLGIAGATEHAIVEMDWGAWEGQTREELIARYGDEFKLRTRRGIDLRPHDGESPREVRDRIALWLETVTTRGRHVGAVTHQGVIRAMLSLATGWEMVGPPPVDMDWSSVHVFRAAPGGQVTIHRLNVSLEPP